MADWQPSAPIENLRLRAGLLAAIRQFFQGKGVLEVETPLLAPTTATDPHLESISVTGVFSGDSREYFLQTSPEFAMKKLLVAGSGSIYQLCKAFRQDESSRRHNAEFTMLEWYRLGFDEHQLMDEVEQLVMSITRREAPQRITYSDLFQRHLGIDPHQCATPDLLATAKAHVDFDESGYQRDELLHLLLAQVIEPALTEDCFVYDFPACMSALAATGTNAQGQAIARRFELFVAGMELANGYFELVDADEQRRRFEQDNRQRSLMQRRDLPVDEGLVAALEQGLPGCAGVALGVDRLAMIASGADSIEQVIAFGLTGRGE
ncbi:MAG: EF-P lysine aminoacylase GenX [Gammaproteobacteria bacterium]|nr:EF-P lysine aminoacylase GenX [Gammaproteobacteria bacterium]